MQLWILSQNGFSLIEHFSLHFKKSPAVGNIYLYFTKIIWGCRIPLISPEYSDDWFRLVRRISITSKKIAMKSVNFFLKCRNKVIFSIWNAENDPRQKLCKMYCLHWLILLNTSLISCLRVLTEITPENHDGYWKSKEQNLKHNHTVLSALL